MINIFRGNKVNTNPKTIHILNKDQLPDGFNVSWIKGCSPQSAETDLFVLYRDGITLPKQLQGLTHTPGLVYLRVTDNATLARALEKYCADPDININITHLSADDLKRLPTGISSTLSSESKVVVLPNVLVTYGSVFATNAEEFKANKLQVGRRIHLPVLQKGEFHSLDEAAIYCPPSATLDAPTLDIKFINPKHIAFDPV